MIVYVIVSRRTANVAVELLFFLLIVYFSFPGAYFILLS